jgi:hypothetical protein
MQKAFDGTRYTCCTSAWIFNACHSTRPLFGAERHSPVLYPTVDPIVDKKKMPPTRRHRHIHAPMR